MSDESTKLKNITTSMIQMGGAATGNPLATATISAMINLFWPSDTPNYWDSIRDQVKEYVEAQSVADEKQNLIDILGTGDSVVQGGAKDWLDKAIAEPIAKAIDKRSDNNPEQGHVAALDGLIDLLQNNATHFARLSRAATTLPYFVQMATMHLLGLKSIIEKLQRDSSLRTKFDLPEYENEYKEKCREYWLYSCQAVQAAVDKRLSYISALIEEVDHMPDVGGASTASTSYFYSFQDTFPGITNPVYQKSYSSAADSGSPDDAKNEVTNQRNKYIPDIRKQTLTFWKTTVLDISQAWGKQFIKPAAGRASACSYQGVLHIVYRSEDGLIFHLDSITQAVVQLNGPVKPQGLTDGPLASGDPTIIANQDGLLHVTYIDLDGAVWDIYGAATLVKWQKQQINNKGDLAAAPPAASKGVTAPSLINGTGLHVTFQNADIWDVWYDKGTWYSQKLTPPGKTTDAPLANLSYNLSTNMLGGQFNVFYVDGPGRIWQIWLGTSWQALPLTNRLQYSDGQTEAPLADGTPISLVFRDQQHVVYRSVDGHIWHLWFDTAWHAERITNNVTPAVQQTSNPVAWAVGDQFNIVFQADYHPWHAFYIYNPEQVTGAWFAENLTGILAYATNAGLVDPGLAAFVHNDEVHNEQHVLYRNVAGELLDLCYANSTWNWTTFVPHEED